MMKYPKGSRVEVYRSRERPGGCWRPGEIIDGNGRFYIVMFDGYVSCGSSPIVQRVLSRSVRPCPPVVAVTKLRRGDIVEVLIDFGWSTATVWRVMKKHYIWVMRGANEKIRAKKGDVRIKQSWQNGEWVVVKQRSSNSSNGNKTSTINVICEPGKTKTNHQNNLKTSDDKEAAKNTTNRTRQARLKRKSPCGDNPEPCSGVTEKFRAIEKHGVVLRAPAPTNAGPGTIYPLKVAQERTQTFSLWRKLWPPKETVVEENHFDTDSTLSSVDSCSINSHGICNLHHHTLKSKRSKEYDSYASDAESFYGSSFEDNHYIRHTDKTIPAEAQRCRATSSLACPCEMFLKLILVFAAYAMLR